MADDTGNNVFPFPRIGYNPPPETPPATTHSGPPAPPDQPEAESSAAPARRSPMESLAAVADPGATLPTQPFVPPAEDRAPVPGFVPDTFRAHPEGESSELESAGLGALSLAAMLAVAVAALRGIHTAVTNRRATREQRQAVADAARGGRTSNANASGAGGGGGGRRVQSGHDYARRTLGRTNPSGSGGGGRRGGGGGVSPTRSTTNNRSDGPNRRKDTGPNKPKAPNRKPDSPSNSTDRSRADRKEQRDRARREKASGIHRPSQGSDSTTRSRLRRRGKGTDTADGSSASTRKGPAGGKGRGGRTKAPTDTAGPKGTLRTPKTKPDRRGRVSLDKDSKGSARTRRRSGGGTGPGKTGPGKPKRGTSAKSAKTGSGSDGTGGRTTLGEAIAAESERRLKKRRKHLKPVVTVVRNKNKNRKKGPGKAGPSGNGTGQSSKKSASTRPSTPKAGKMKWKRGRNKSGSPWAGTRRRIRTRWQRRQATWTGGAGSAGSGGRRRTPFQAAGMAAGAAYGATYTVERIDNPGDQERRWEPRPPRARAAAGALAPPRPGGPAPAASGPGPSAAAAPSNSTKGAGMSLPANSTPGFNLAPSMSSEHTTEVTLDSTLDTLAGLTKDSFATHDEAVKLARKAKQLRYALEELAADLQSRHNVIGRITGAAMALLAEAMEILSAKADAMAVNSLTAAELSEAAEQAMFDAYKPVQQATADAGLAVPSARIHNEG